MNTRLAAWSVSGTQQDTWRIHSTLVLPDAHVITTLDNKAGMIFRFKTDASFYLLQAFLLSALRKDFLCIPWSLKMTSRLGPKSGQRRKRNVSLDSSTIHHLISSTPTPVLLNLAPSLTFIATVTAVRYGSISCQ